jgi:hypothetical protein
MVVVPEEGVESSRPCGHGILSRCSGLSTYGSQQLFEITAVGGVGGTDGVFGLMASL